MTTECMTETKDFYAIADRCLLSPYDIDAARLQQVLGQILTHHIDYADLYFQYSRSEGWMLEEGIVKSGSFNIEQGVGVRAISGEKTGFAYSDDISMPALVSAAQATRAIANQGGTHSVQVVKRNQMGRQTQLYLPEDPIASLKDADKVALLERLERYTRQLDRRVTQVIASLAGEYDVVLVTRSDGLLAADVRPLVRLSLQVIAEENGRREQGVAGGGGRFSYAYFTDEVLQDYAQKAVHQAVVNLDARPAPAGTMTVVLGSGWPGILLHEAIGHGLEGDFNRKGSSAFSGRVGERVAAPGVTVVDDGTIPQRRGSLNIDDEGNPTQCTVLIEDGILRGYLQDSLNARLMDLPVTGNGRRESFAHIPMPRMTNTYMLNGDKDPAEIIASVKHGLYAANFGGGQVDITSGKFVFSAAEAYMIEDGKITYPVKGATLIGNGPDVLTRVSMIGNDMLLDPGVGTCGKEGQSVPVGVGQPTLRIDGLTVGGTGI
ncbi:MAG: metalloprotease TldD [Nitrosomonas sp.]|uniref:metalloprotease TldD n=1 Tax=Nitrosomonas sp. TaxID=42353 RepID=UPI002726670D|nr:metalloprotease TldD [Nitrosomonas sp.]MDO8895224.1 metalloprotease TldD [Nitrosomonas sp.]MDO9470147.1 metalloprotease TldD [Nitrosomonas sp.]MDP1933626.1 metalloprotease TldD [Nitrosomonas sp.]MDP2223087.1 metalloprotease TldD [Nitrosomonas sp.]MDP3663240.1 metalloprotease TldD [Nitrosomonas sp.]